MKSCITVVISLLCFNTYAEQANLQNHDPLSYGISLIEQGQPEKALNYWLSVRPELQTPHPKIGFEFIKTVAAIEDEKYHNVASIMYKWGISAPITENNKRYFEEELERLRPLMEHKDFKPLSKALKNNDDNLDDLIKSFWNEIDPTPLTNANERLIEHWKRVEYVLNNYIPEGKEKRFENVDDRAGVYLKYGPPDRDKDGFLRYDSGQIAYYIRSRQTTSNSRLQEGLDNNMETQTRRLHNDAAYKVWIYEGINKNKDELIYLFGQGANPNSYDKKRSITDFIPRSAFGGNNRNSTDINILSAGSNTSGNSSNSNSSGVSDATNNGLNDLVQAFNNSSSGGTQTLSHPATPAMLLMMMYSEQLSAQAPFYGKMYDDMIVDYLDTNTRVSSSLDYEYRNYEKHYIKSLESLSPPEVSNDISKIPSINNQLLVRRFLNNQKDTYAYIFANSELTGALNLDLRHNKNIQITPDDYVIKHGLAGYKTKENSSIFREVIEAILYKGDNEQKFYANSTFRVNYNLLPDGDIVFSSELHNESDESKPLSKTTFSPSLRGLGNSSIDLPEPLVQSGLELSDIVVGYDYKEAKSEKFPFKISFGEPMPPGKNIVFYFEAYGLTKTSDGLYSGKLNYEINKKKGFKLFRSNKNDISINLNLKSDTPRYSNAIEVQTEELDAGDYTLTLILEDQNGNEVEREVKFTLE